MNIEESINQMKDALDLGATANQRHGYILLIDGKPFITSDGKIMFNRQETLMSNFRWQFKRKIYNWLLEHGQIPLNSRHEIYGGTLYNGSRYLSSWTMYQRQDFKMLQKKLLAKLKAEGRIKVQFI